MPGEAFAIAGAFLSALTSAIFKTQMKRMNVTLLAAVRTVPAVLIYWGLLLFAGRFAELFQLPIQTWALLLGSTVVGLVVGDLLYFQSLKLVGLSRAGPLASTYPFFTMLLAWTFLGEELGWTIIGGAVLIALGAYLLAFPRGAIRDRGHEGPEVNLAGIVMVLIASICWSASTVMLRVGVEGVDIVRVNAIRLAILVVALFAIAIRRGKVGRLKDYGLRTLGIVLVTGLLSTALGTFVFVSAVQKVGAAKTSILTATMPLFGVPFSLILGERLTVRTLLGTALTVAGVWLTV